MMVTVVPARTCPKMMPYSQRSNRNFQTIDFRSMKINENSQYVVIHGKRLLRSNKMLVLDRESGEVIEQYGVGLVDRLSGEAMSEDTHSLSWYNPESVRETVHNGLKRDIPIGRIMKWLIVEENTFEGISSSRVETIIEEIPAVDRNSGTSPKLSQSPSTETKPRPRLMKQLAVSDLRIPIRSRSRSTRWSGIRAI